MMPEIGMVGALLAGLLAFLSPCILPMVPFYLCYLGGLSMAELHSDGKLAPGAQRRMMTASLGFALGVTSIFMLMGLGATALGRLFTEWQGLLSILAAGILLVFGLHLVGVLRIPLLNRQARIETGANPATLPGAYVMGLAFGFGWTPCVGPALAAILMVASTSGDPLRGTGLLLIFGLAMTLPFTIAALFIKPFLGWAGCHSRALAHLEKAMGAMLILFAILIATGSVNLIAQWMITTFDWSAVLI